MYLKVHIYLWALCCFNLMPCVISMWSPDLVFVVFVTTKSDPGQCPSTLGDAFFPVAYGGEKVPWLCMGEAATHRANRPHAKKVLFNALSLLPMGGKKTLRLGVKLLPIGPRDSIPERTISCQLWMGEFPDRSIW